MNISGSLTLFGLVLFAVLIAYIAWVLVERQNRRPRRISVTVVLALVVGGIVAMSLGVGLVFIEPQERGIVIRVRPRRCQREQQQRQKDAAGPEYHHDGADVTRLSAPSPGRCPIHGAAWARRSSSRRARKS